MASSVLFIVGQVLLLGLLYMVYRMGRHLAVGREPEALANARDVWSFERLLDLPNESAIQQLALHSTELLELANRFYIGVHFPASILFLVWVLVRHREAWPRVRTVILASTGVALVIHIVYPLAPPRFLPQVLPHVTFVDTGAVFGPSAYSAGETVANQYAAMPSLHVGWSILVAWGVVTILRARARWLIVAHPVITTIVVVITANHYWLDGLIGGGLVVAAVQLTRPEVRARMRLWTISAGQRVRGRARVPEAVTAHPVTAALTSGPVITPGLVRSATVVPPAARAGSAPAAATGLLPAARDGSGGERDVGAGPDPTRALAMAQAILGLPEPGGPSALPDQPAGAEPDPTRPRDRVTSRPRDLVTQRDPVTSRDLVTSVNGPLGPEDRSRPATDAALDSPG